MEFKRQVIRTKIPDKQEIKFNTNLFGSKTFMIAVEPVLDTNDVCVGLNYAALDVTLQVYSLVKTIKEDCCSINFKSVISPDEL